jgi:uncharacterized RDD family membrane protein YckC
MSDPGQAPRPDAGAPDYAPWPLRAVSLIVDNLALFALPFLAFLLITLLGLVDANGDPTPLGLVIWIPACLLALGFGLWNRILLDGRDGQSVGRRVMGIRLVGLATRRPIGPGKAFLRGLAHMLDNLPCACLPVGFLWPLWDPKRQTFADMLVGSIVIRVPR